MDTSLSPEWRPVPGYEGHYEASTEGLIRTIARRRKGGTYWPAVFLRPIQSASGRSLYVSLSRNGKKRTMGVHRVIAMTFHGTREGMDARHIDGDAGNNRASNIEWREPIARRAPVILTPEELARRRRIKEIGLSELIRSDLTDPAHGSKSTYDRHQCRCARCREANSNYMRAYRENRRSAA